jgi:hypothetical protein
MHSTRNISVFITCSSFPFLTITLVHLEDLDVDGRIFKQQVVGMLTEQISLWMGTNEGTLEDTAINCLVLQKV